MGSALVMQKISIVEKISFVDGWMNAWMGGWVGGWMDGWMGEWMGEWMDGWIENFVNVTELYSLVKTPKI